jgi:hypothetical protein
MMALVLAWFACAPAVLDFQVDVEGPGLVITADAPMDGVRVRTVSGEVAAEFYAPVPQESLWVPVPWTPGERFRVEAWSAELESRRFFSAPAADGPVSVLLEVPLGQAGQPLQDGARIEVATPEQGRTPIGVVVTALQPSVVRVITNGAVESRRLGTVGERGVFVLEIDAEVDLRIEVGGWGRTAALVPVSAGDLSQSLALVSSVFPAAPNGKPDPARPQGRVTLPSAGWAAWIRHTGLGLRPADDQAPWAWEGFVLRNDGEAALNVVITSEVLDAAGLPVHAFRPRLRELDGGLKQVSALVRLPPGEDVEAVLPLFVDRQSAEEGRWTRRFRVSALGASEALLEQEDPLYVTRGNAWASLGFAGALGASLLGLGLLFFRSRRWLSEFATSELMTISLFGALCFAANAASQLVALVASAVLGPFSPLLTGLLDDAFRICLLSTLVTLLPRPGAVALAVLVGTLLRGLALGSFTPVDGMLLGGTVAFLEAGLWLAGLTRSTDWRNERPFLRWVRLSVAFGGASVLASATGLAAAVVLYRLFLAQWYVVMILALPGFLYVLVACWVAVGFADSLRAVES